GPRLAQAGKVFGTDSAQDVSAGWSPRSSYLHSCNAGRKHRALPQRGIDPEDASCQSKQSRANARKPFHLRNAKKVRTARLGLCVLESLNRSQPSSGSLTGAPRLAPEPILMAGFQLRLQTTALFLSQPVR